jgi:hypothetical protein
LREIVIVAQRFGPAIVLAGAAVFVSACGTPQGRVQSANVHASAGNKVTNEQLPINQRFRTLDEYLSYLELQSHNDGKWYKEIRPGVYEMQTGNLHLMNDTQQRIFTRAELEKKFGFTR